MAVGNAVSSYLLALSSKPRVTTMFWNWDSLKSPAFIGTVTSVDVGVVGSIVIS